MEEFESSLKIRVRPSTRFVFAFGKYEIYAGLPEEERKVNEMLRKKKLTPFFSNILKISLVLLWCSRMFRQGTTICRRRQYR